MDETLLTLRSLDSALAELESDLWQGATKGNVANRIDSIRGRMRKLIRGIDPTAEETIPIQLACGQ